MTASTNPAETTSKKRPLTGAEYLESIRDNREIWIYGQRVEDVTTHPAFRNSARTVAGLYDALHDPKHAKTLTAPTDTGNGGFTHCFYRVPRTTADMEADRDAIAGWQRLVYGFMGRSPDYKASFLATLGANADFYEPYQENAKRWYRDSQEQVLFLNHAIVNPPVDRGKPPEEVADVCVHVEKETDAGIVVSGAKVVATGSALTHYNFISHYGLPLQDRRFAAIFMVPMDAPGLKLIARQSYEMIAAHVGSPFDYPLSSRLDENDSILILDRVLVPWENVFAYGDVEKVNNFIPHSGFLSRAMFHGCVRLAVKFDFLCGVMLKAVDAIGNRDLRGVQIALGEMLAWRSTFWSHVEGMIQGAQTWKGGALLPGFAAASAYRVLSVQAYGRLRELIETTVGSSLIYMNSNVADFRNPEIRKDIDRYIRGSEGVPAVERVKIMKLLWDAVGSEFGARHELYERNYSGNVDDARVQNLLGLNAAGTTDELRAFADQCLAEYDLDGWKTPGLVNPDDVNLFSKT